MLKDGEITVALSCSEFGEGHLGLAFFDVKGDPMLLHMAWHHIVLFEKIESQKHCWVGAKLDLEIDAVEQLAIFFESVINNFPALSSLVCYGTDFKASKGSFSHEGEYNCPQGSIGLTCASFVLEILRAGQLVLVDIETWRPSEANDKWIERVASSLESRGHHNQAAAVRSRANGCRLRPVELAGAATSAVTSMPLTFEATLPLAEKAHASLSAHCGC